jgi:pilus assembly protein Flp/PilA
MGRKRRGADGGGRVEVNLRSEIMLKHAKKFLSDDCGATAIEYALMSSLIALALVTVLGQVGSRLSAEFSEVSSALK